jgi:hypothetical protein
MRNPDIPACTVTLDELIHDAATNRGTREAEAHLGVVTTVVCNVERKQRGRMIVRDSIIT